jgi:hypothetical protein
MFTVDGGGSLSCNGSGPTGACCLADGSCTVVTGGVCGILGGIYRGDNAPCSTAMCPQPPTGACCTTESCSIVTQAQCTTMSGTYHGNGSTCQSSGCPVNLVCNGGFESGSFGPCWTQFGNTAFTAVTSGVFGSTGPHSGNFAAHFGPQTTPGGIQQTLNGVHTGDMVTVDFWFAIDPSTPNSFAADLGTTNLISLTNETGRPTWTHFVATVPAPSDNPVLKFTARHDPEYVFLDDILVTVAGGSTCYANCDGSSGTPFLNVNDFICFQNKFASGDSYANCDGSTGNPTLNVNDFICFQNKFAAGCSAP